MLLLLTHLAIAASTIHFRETFDDNTLAGWVKSTWKQNLGAWAHSPAFFGDENDKGLQTTQDNRFYAISAKFPAFSNENANLVIQYQIRFPQKVECGGGYLKIGPSSLDQAEWGGDSKYHIMFGPDLCGTSIKKTSISYLQKELKPLRLIQNHKTGMTR
jgi:calreticulin